MNSGRKYPELKIIAISGGGRISPEGYLPGAKLLGADMVFQKPLDQKEFLQAVASLLNESEEKNFPETIIVKQCTAQPAHPSLSRFR